MLLGSYMLDITLKKSSHVCEAFLRELMRIFAHASLLTSPLCGLDVVGDSLSSVVLSCKVKSTGGELSGHQEPDRTAFETGLFVSSE